MSDEYEDLTTDIPEDDEPKIWSQSQLNTAFKSHRQKLRRDLQAAQSRIQELEEGRDIKSAIDVESGKWQAQVDELMDSHSRALSAKDTEHQAALADLQSQYAALQSKVTADNISRELTAAATAGDAVHPEQVTALLRPYASISGDSVTINIDGFSLSPAEVIKWMNEQPEKYGNLFRANVVGGLGSNSLIGGATGKRTTDIRSMSPADYRRLKASNPRALGLEPQS